MEKNYFSCLKNEFFFTALLQFGADPNIKNTDGKTALDLSDPTAKAVLTGNLLQVVNDLALNHFIREEFIACLHVLHIMCYPYSWVASLNPFPVREKCWLFTTVIFFLNIHLEFKQKQYAKKNYFIVF